MLLGINITFSIIIPLNAQPSVFISHDFIKHFIFFEFPGLESKRATMIFIENFKKFTLENKLLKMLAYGLGDFYKKKKGEYKGGKLSCLLKTPKNSFSFFETTPFELYIDCTELGMDIENIKIVLNKTVYMNHKKRRKHFGKVSRVDLLDKKLYFK